MMSMGSTDPTKNPRFEDYEKLVRQTSQRLAQEGVALYIVDAKGLETSRDTSAARSGAPMPLRGRGNFEPQVDAERASSDPKPAMHLMASITGGRYLYDTNDLAEGFRKTVADLRGAYTLGFYAPEEPDNKWHKLRVRVDRPGLSVRHREGYQAAAAAPAPVEWGYETWRAVISNPLGSSIIPLTAHCETAPGGEIVLTLVVDVKAFDFRADGGKLKADLQAAIVDRTADGQIRPQFSTLSPSVPAAEWRTCGAGHFPSPAVEARPGRDHRPRRRPRHAHRPIRLPRRAPARASQHRATQRQVAGRNGGALPSI